MHVVFSGLLNYCNTHGHKPNFHGWWGGGGVAFKSHHKFSSKDQRFANKTLPSNFWVMQCSAPNCVVFLNISSHTIKWKYVCDEIIFNTNYLVTKWKLRHYYLQHSSFSRCSYIHGGETKHVYAHIHIKMLTRISQQT